MIWRLTRAALAALGLLALASGTCLSQSTIVPTVPAQNAPLNSAPVRSNFAAAYSDINGLLGMHPATTLGGCPVSPLVGTDCLVSGIPADSWYKYTGAVGGWGLIGTLNTTTGAFGVALSSANIVQSSPITVNVAAGVATIGLNYSAPLNLSGSNLTCSVCAVINATNTFSASQNFTSASFSGQVTSTVSTGQAPLVIASTTKVSNLYVDRAALADTVTTNANLTGDVTSVGNATTIAAAAVTYSKFQNVAASSLVGNPTGSPATAQGITLGSSTLAFSGTTLQTGAGTGDVTWSANSFTTTIAANAVTYAKFQQVAASRLLGDPTGSPANVSEISLGATLAFSGTALQTGAGTGDVTWSANSFATTVASNAVTYAKFQQVAASRLLGNPTGSPANVSEISLGATLSFSGTALQTAALTGDVTASANSFATTVGKVNGVTYPSAPSANTVPVVTSATSGGTVTYEAVPNAALANSSITIGGASTALGSSVTASTILDSVGSTRGSVLYRGASGWAALTPGTAGLALTSGGAGADPSYATLANAALTNSTVTIGSTAISLGGTATTIAGSVTFSGTLNASGTFQIGGTAVALPISLANGGTNNGSLVASNGGIVYSDASKLQILAGTVTASQCLLSGSSAAPTWGSCSGGAAVSSVSNSDGTLTISPTTGAVVASIALGHANTWTAKQIISTAGFALSGNISATAWTTSGVRYADVAGTLTDTSSSGTVAAAYTSVHGGNTIAASNATTFTHYYGEYFKAETNGTNVTLTNTWGFGGDSMRVGTSNQVTITAAGAVSLPGTTTAGGTLNVSGTFQSGGNTMTFPGSAGTLAALNIADQTLSGGANVTSLSQSTGNITVDCGARPLQYITGATSAWTITAPSSDGSCILALTNAGASAVIPSFSGFTVSSNTGDTLTTTASSKFWIWIGRINSVSSYSVKALQ